MRILIIEDEAHIRETLRDILEIHGHTVTAAEDGPAGARLAGLVRPELILCDVGLPGMDGYEVIRAVQQIPSCREVPFIFLTARADRDSQRRGMELGADDYITKPFSEREIIDAIEARVRRQQPLRERVERLLAIRQREVNAPWSHELLTPLNGVLGGLELIEAEADTIRPGELKELLGLIRAGAERQQALSRKLIVYYDLERVRALAERPHVRSNAAACIHSATNRTVLAANRLTDVAVFTVPGHVPLTESHLDAAIAELVENALRFSRPGSPVTVSGTRDRERYRIEISDRGPGLPDEHRAQVAPFVQFGRSQRNQQGLGLGLTIAQLAAEVAGGQLLLGPPPDGGRGLRATLDLPATD